LALRYFGVSKERVPGLGLFGNDWLLCKNGHADGAASGDEEGKETTQHGIEKLQ